MNILLFFLGFIGVFLLIMVYRNHWVCDARCKMIDEDFGKYRLLPPYDLMLLKFWVWDVNKFLPTNNG